MRQRDEIIEELVSLILMQDEEIKKLKKKIRQIKQYIEVYEEYIKRGDY
jgi:peptidoglycan hydrolase CwlO-like protein